MVNCELCHRDIPWLRGVCPICQWPIESSRRADQLNRGVVSADVTCRRCKYNLRGLDVGVACSECSKPVVDSLRSPFLHIHDLAGLRRLNTSILLVWVAAGALISLLFVGISLTSVIRYSFFVLSGLAVLLLAALFLGVYLVTAANPFPTSGMASFGRLTARVGAALPLFAVVLINLAVVYEQPSLGLAAATAALLWLWSLPAYWGHIAFVLSFVPDSPYQRSVRGCIAAYL